MSLHWEEYFPLMQFQNLSVDLENVTRTEVFPRGASGGNLILGELSLNQCPQKPECLSLSVTVN